jgi:phosphoglucomutase
MDAWRTASPQAVAGIGVASRLDYMQDVHGLPLENVLKFVLEDGSWFCLRPSGTEPKIKMYFAVKADTLAQAQQRLDRIMSDVMERIDSSI